VTIVRASAACALVGLAILVAGLRADAAAVWLSYLDAWTFAMGLCVGTLILLMTGHAAKAAWMVVTRRWTEAVASAFPALLVLFVPVFFALPRVYPWAAPSWGAGDPMSPSGARRGYFEPRFFVARTLLYFAVFIVIGSALRAWSRKNDTEPRLDRVRKMRTWSGGGLPVVALTLTWACIDWTMSLTPTWTSTIYGLYWFSGTFVGAIALCCVFLHFARVSPRVRLGVTGDHALAIGRLLFAMTCFWAYMAFSQLLIIWIADLPEEVPFYLARTTGSWTVVTYGLVFGHFVVPFFALLNRRAKRSTAYMAAVGAWMLAMHFVDVAWLILPARDPGGVRVRWFDLGPLLWVGGVICAWVAAQYRRVPALPRYAPELAEGLDYEAMP
jgi:hypothetical protein